MLSTANQRLAHRVAQLLQARQFRLVLAESCTAGLISATLGCIPGISSHFCGSMVVYRDLTKHSWLGLPCDVLEKYSAVSREVTRHIAEEVLRVTPESTLALGITGHLGPNCPPDLDGCVYVAICPRLGDRIGAPSLVAEQLRSTGRRERQLEATGLALGAIVRFLEQPDLLANV